MDVTKQDQIKKDFNKVCNAVGKGELTALVNNAGFDHYGSIEFMPIESTEQQFQVNVFGFSPSRTSRIAPLSKKV